MSFQGNQLSVLGKAVPATILMLALPALAWAHPGHGLDDLWVHDMLHGATALAAIALAVLLAVRFVRNRKKK